MGSVVPNTGLSGKVRVNIMKKRVWKLLTVAMVAVMLLTGCGAEKMAATDSAMNQAMSGTSSNAGGAMFDGFEYFVEEDMVQIETEEMKPEAPQAQAPETGKGIEDNAADAQVNTTTRKLIRRVYLSTETKEFDDFVAFVNGQTTTYGGYIENSDVSGTSYHAYNHTRRASIVIRVPAKHLDAFIAQIGNMANITSKSESSEDVTLSYIETESRIASLEIQRDKLLEWMEDAETVEELIKLEERLSEVRYQLEYYGGILRNYDNLVEFSTITLDIREVERMTIQEPDTVGDRIGKGLSDNLYEIAEGFKNFIVWFVTSLPYLLIWAVIIVAAVLVIRVIAKKAKIKKQKRMEAYQQQYNQSLALQNQYVQEQNSEEKKE